MLISTAVLGERGPERHPATGPLFPLRVTGQVLGPEGTVPPETRITLHPLPSPVDELRQRLISDAGPTRVATSHPGAGGWFELLVPRVGFWKVRVEAPGHLAVEHLLAPLLDHRSLAPLELRPDLGLSFEPEPFTASGALALRARPTRPRTDSHALGGGWRPVRREIRLPPEVPLPDRMPRAAGEALDVEILFPDGRILRWFGAEAIDRTTPAMPGATGQDPAELVRPRRVELVENDGRPLAQAVVRLPGLDGWPVARTDTRGRASLPRRTGELWAVADDGLTRRFAPSAPEAPGTPTVVRLAEPRILQVELRSRATGRPLLGALGTENQRHITDAMGRAVLRLDVDDPPTLWATAPTHLPWSGRPPATTEGSWVVELEPAAALGGRVVDADDRALSGVEVRILGGRGRGVRQGWSDGQGRFHLGPLETGLALRLELRRPDLRRLVLEIPPLEPGERRHEPRIVLGSAALLLGRVVDGQGEPVADAEVDLGPTRLDREPKGQAGSGDGAEILSRADGRFAARVTEPGFLDLDLRAEGFAPRRLPGIQVDVESDRLDLGDLVLRPPARVWGRVVDSEDNPLPEVAIYRFEPQLGRPDRLPYYLRFRRPETRTDDRGAFDLDTLPPASTSTLAFQHSGHALAILRGVRAPGEAPLRVVLHPARTLVGQVVDASGEAVATADLRWWQDDRSGATVAHGRRTSDAQGRFELPGVPVGTVVVEAASQRHRGTSIELEVEVGGEPEDLLLVLGRGSVVAGRVLTAGGSPVRHAALSLVYEGPLDSPLPAWSELPTRPPAGRRGDSEADGSFRFEGLRAGLWQLRATRELVDKTMTLEVSTDATLDVDLVLGGEGEPIEGWVVVENGASPRGVLLRLDPLGEGRTVLATADDSGRVVFADVVAGIYRVAVSASGERAGPPIALAEDPGPWRIDGDPETAEPSREIRVGLGAKVGGQVLGLGSDAWLQVQVEAEGERAIYTPRASRLDRAGRYQLRGLGLGPWTLRAFVPGTGLQAGQRLEILPGQTEIEVDLDFAAGLTLRGQVRRDEEVVRQGTLVLQPPDGAPISQPLDPDGRFHFTGLTAGDHRLEVVLPTGVHRQTIPLAISGEWDIELP